VLDEDEDDDGDVVAVVVVVDDDDYDDDDDDDDDDVDDGYPYDKVWDVATLELVQSFKGHRSPSLQCAFLRNDELVLSCCADEARPGLISIIIIS
jgi:WD40 repeat protein